MHHSLEALHSFVTLPSSGSSFSSLGFVEKFQVVSSTMLRLHERTDVHLLNKLCANQIRLGGSCGSNQLVETAHVHGLVAGGKHEQLCFCEFVTQSRDHSLLEIFSPNLPQLSSMLSWEIPKETSPGRSLAPASALSPTTGLSSVTTTPAAATVLPASMPGLHGLPTLAGLLATALFDLPALSGLFAAALLDLPALAGLFAAFFLYFPTLAGLFTAFGGPAVVVMSCK